MDTLHMLNTTLLRKEASRILYEILDRTDVHLLVDEDNVLHLSKRFRDTCAGCDEAIQDGSVGSPRHDDFVHECGTANNPHQEVAQIEFDDTGYLRGLITNTLAALDASINPKKKYHVSTSLVAVATMEVDAQSGDLAIQQMESAIKQKQGRFAKVKLASSNDTNMEIIIDFDIDEIEARVIDEGE